MRRRREEIEEVEESENEGAPEEELSEKDLKKKKRKESLEKRKNAKRKDKVARWGGVILLGLIMFVGFLLWVLGEMKMEDKGVVNPRVQELNSSRSVIVK